MSEEVADLRRQLARMTSQMQRLEAASRQTWGFAPTGGGAASAPPVYLILGNNALPGSGQVGIAKRTDAVLASELPVPAITPTPNTGDTVTVPAFPAPSPLPNGLGVATQFFNNAYVFVLLDNRSAIGYDLFAGNNFISGGTVTLSKVSAGVTYNYVCQVPYVAR
jgi:hypothetical protein